MKKITAFLLAAVLIFSLAFSAGAVNSADSVEARLTAVTLKVKKILSVSDDYTEFYGDLQNDGDRPIWSLNWYGEGTELCVSTGEDGKIYSFNLYEDDGVETYYRGGFEPHFPRVTRSEALAEAGKSVSGLLDANESVSFEETADVARDSDKYSFRGTLCVNGVPTEFRVRATVRLADMKLVSFSRDDEYVVISGWPAAKPGITQAKAAGLFEGVYTPRLEYRSVTDSDTVRLVYGFDSDAQYYVNAASGALIDKSSLYGGGFGYAAASDTANTAAGYAEEERGVSLTDAELTGIEKLDGALSSQEIDKIVRAEKILGVSGVYELSRVDYSLDRASGDITASASYMLRLDASNCSSVGVLAESLSELEEKGMKPSVSKRFELNGKTGAILSGSTYYYGFGYESEAAEAEALPESVKAWLAKNYEFFAQTEVYNSFAESYPVNKDFVTFAQKANGYFFPENRIDLSVNRAAGTLDSFSFAWNDAVSFEKPATDMINGEKALDIYIASFSNNLRYVSDYSGDTEYSWPQKAKALLVWSLDTDGRYVSGVFASDGSLLADELRAETALSYDDIASDPERGKIEKLAEFGIGFGEDSFKPLEKLTELDMLRFFLSAEGYMYASDADSEPDLDSVYYSAKAMGLFSGERNPDRLVTRSDAVSALVSALGFGEAAQLGGIYAQPFSDVPASSKECGYIALAKGLKIVSGDAAGTFRPAAGLTRREAAVMLYNLMSR